MPRNVTLDDPPGTRVVRNPINWPYGTEDCNHTARVATKVYIGTILQVDVTYIYVRWDSSPASHTGYGYNPTHLLIHEEVTQPNLIVNNQNNQQNGKSVVSHEITTVRRGQEQVYRSLKCSVEGTIIKRVNDQNRRVTSTG